VDEAGPGAYPPGSPGDAISTDSTDDDLRVVAIAASAGGLETLGTLLAELPADLPAAVLVVQHLAPTHESHIADILGRATELPVRTAQDGDPVEPSVVLVAPPDHHLLVSIDGRVQLGSGERVRFLRPSADLLLDSVAAAYAERAIAVVLSGTGMDGAAGVRTIKAAGGQVLVESPDTAKFAGMPNAAVATGFADAVLPVEDLGPELMRRLGRGKDDR